MKGASVPNIDVFGEQGGAIGSAFGAGAVACFGFIKAFVTGPVNKAYERRISELEADKGHCNDRVTMLEGLLLFHGGGELRQQMQKALSEEHLERLRVERGKKP